MTVKQLFKNLTKPKNLWYIIQSKVRQAIKPLPDKAILDKVANHPQCYFSGECQRCGCDFHDVIASDKKCEDYKEGDTIAIKNGEGEHFITTYNPTISHTNFIVLKRIKDEL